MEAFAYFAVGRGNKKSKQASRRYQLFPLDLHLNAGDFFGEDIQPAGRARIMGGSRTKEEREEVVEAEWGRKDGKMTDTPGTNSSSGGVVRIR